VDTKKWVFLTGPKEQLYLAARESYKLDDPKNNVASIKDQFIHTQLFALVDKEGNVRGMSYDGLKSNDIKQLKVDIVRLLNEK
jgi:protein SCO1/2